MKVAQLPSRRRKQNIIIIILLIGLPLLLFVAYQVIQLVTKASGDTDPKNVVVSNLTASMITVSWTTDTKTYGTIIPLENGREKTEVKDARGTGKRYTHYVELQGLQPNTQYSFKIKSNNTKYTSSEGKDLVFTTAPVSVELPSVKPVFGNVKSAFDDDVLVYVLLGDKTTFPASATLLASKEWMTDLSALLKTADKSRVTVTNDTSLTVLVQAGEGQGAMLTGSYSSLFDSDGSLKESNELVLEEGIDIYAQIPDAAKLLLKYQDDPEPPEPPNDPELPEDYPDIPDIDEEDDVDISDDDNDYDFTNRQYRIVHHLQWEELGEIISRKSSFIAGPSTVRVTNLTDTGFTVLWVSEKKEKGSVRFGLSPTELDQVAYDQRDGLSTKGSYYVHSVKLDRLRIDTEYFYEIISGDDVYNNNEKMYSTKTLSNIEMLSPYTSVSGGTSNIPDHGEVFLIAKIEDGDKIGSLGDSYEISVPVDEKGNWTISIDDMRSKDGNSYFEYTEGDVLILEPYTTAPSSPQEESMEGIDQRKDIVVELVEQQPEPSSPTVISQLTDYGITNDPSLVATTKTDEIPKTGILDSFIGIVMIASSISLSGILIYIFSRKNSKKNGKMSKNL